MNIYSFNYFCFFITSFYKKEIPPEIWKTIIPPKFYVSNPKLVKCLAISVETKLPASKIYHESWMDRILLKEPKGKKTTNVLFRLKSTIVSKHQDDLSSNKIDRTTKAFGMNNFFSTWSLVLIFLLMHRRHLLSRNVDKK